MTRIMCLLGLLFCAGMAWAVDEVAARSTAIAFLQQINPSGLSAEIENLGARLSPVTGKWTVSGTYCMVGIDGSTGQVDSYENGLIGSRSMMGPESRRWPQSGAPFFASQQELIATARAKLNGLGWHNGPGVRHEPMPAADSTGKVPRQILSFEFFDKPGGFEARAGNTASISLDSLSGEIVGMRRMIGFRYASMPVGVSREQAIAQALDHTSMRSPVDVRGPWYMVLQARDQLSARGAALSASKTLPLVYFVRGAQEDVLVAADTGEVLAHFNNATGDGPRKRPGPTALDLAQASGRAGSSSKAQSATSAGAARSEKPDSGESAVRLAAALTGLAILGGAGWALWRRGRPIRPVPPGAPS